MGKNSDALWTDEGKLTPKAIWIVTERVRNDLDPKCSACPMESAEGWGVTEGLVGLPDIADPTQGGVPMIALTCDNCGHTRTFNASIFFGLPVEAGVLTRLKHIRPR